MLTRSETVMRISGKTKFMPPNTIPFDCEEENDNTRQTDVAGGQEDVVRDHHFYLDKQVWEDFGRPEIITVSVVAGDTLNDREMP